MIQPRLIRIIFFGVLVLVSQIALSQDTLLKYQTTLKIRPKMDGDYETRIAATDGSGKFVAVISDKEKSEYAIFNKDFSLVASNKNGPSKESVELYKQDWPRIQGAIMNDKSASFIHVSNTGKNKKLLYNVWSEIVQYDGKLSHKLVAQVPYQENVITWLFGAEKGYLICTDDEKKELIFYIIDASGGLEVKRVPINLNDYYKTKYTLYDYFGYATSIYSQLETNLKSESSPTKFFLDSDKIVIVSIVQGQPPHIWNFNLNDFKPKFFKLDLSSFTGYSSGSKYFNNATFYDGKIFVMNVTRKITEIGIFDSTGARILKKYEIKEGSKFYFSELPRETIYNLRKPEIDMISNYGSLAVMLTEATLAISTKKLEDGSYLITAGSYDEKLRTSGVNAYNIPKVIQFRVILNPKTLEQVEELYTTPNDITELTQRLELVTPYAQFRPFKWNGINYLSYFTPKDGLFRVQTAVVK